MTMEVVPARPVAPPPGWPRAGVGRGRTGAVPDPPPRAAAWTAVRAQRYIKTLQWKNGQIFYLDLGSILSLPFAREFAQDTQYV